MEQAKQDYRGLYEQIVKSEWFKKAYHNKSLGECPIVVEELEESEDERIRKDIINLIYWLKANPSLCSQYYNDRYDSILAWLEKQKDINCLACDQHLKGYLAGRKVTEEEKQKEQKPVEQITDAEMKESMDAVTDFKVFAADLAKTFNITHKRDIDWHNFCAGLLTYLGRNKPVEWSEEDEKTLDDLLWLCDRWDEGKNNVLPSKETITKVRKMLKSLLPQK